MLEFAYRFCCFIKSTITKREEGKVASKNDILKYRLFVAFDLILLLLIFSQKISIKDLPSPTALLSPIPLSVFQNKAYAKSGKEVFGFAPYWTFNKLDNVDFGVLTTLAYFDLETDSSGDLDTTGPGYQTFMSDHATQVFNKAHSYGDRVVVTVTNMDADSIRALMDDQSAQDNLISNLTTIVKDRGIDGVNIDFEYAGNPGQGYRNKYTRFIHNLTARMHQEVAGSEVSISVYASAVKEPKIYDISDLGKEDIKIFMMAYDFGYAGSDNVMPTSPLYGAKEGKYWYDVSTAVEDFLALMPAQKLILGTPWYGYNYAISGKPKVNAPTGYGYGVPETYTLAKEDIHPNMEGITAYKEGWDNIGKVGWKAYFAEESGTWRMLFLDDAKSLGIKYDFAKDKNLAGVGMWALGFDDGNPDLWNVLRDKFGVKIADSRVPGTNL